MTAASGHRYTVRAAQLRVRVEYLQGDEMLRFLCLLGSGDTDLPSSTPLFDGSECLSMFTGFLHRFLAQEVVARRISPSPLHSMMFAVSTVSATVSHNLEPPNHLSNTEKSEHFCSDNAGAHKCVAVEISYAREEVLRIGCSSHLL